MSKFDFQKAISKYAILLSVCYAFGLVLVYGGNNLLTRSMLEHPNFITRYFALIPWMINSLFNIVFAILVYRDFRRCQTKNPLIVFVTLFFGFIGIALFFIQLIYKQSVERTSTPQEG